jgi:hypothetical protein
VHADDQEDHRSMSRQAGRWIKPDKTTWAPRQNKVRCQNSEDNQVDFEQTKDLCSLDASEEKAFENAILYGPAERSQRKCTAEPNRHRLPAPL